MLNLEAFKVGLPTGSIYTKSSFWQTTKQTKFETILTELKNSGIDTIEVHYDFPQPETILQAFPNASFHLTKTSKAAGAIKAINLGFSRIIAHPNYIKDTAEWRELGAHLLIENMDPLHPKLRSAKDLEVLLSKLPEAGICLDLAHAMDKPILLDEIISAYGNRIRQVHLGEINMLNGHHLSTISPRASKHCIAYLKQIQPGTPIIFELALGSNWQESLATTKKFAEDYPAGSC